MDTDDLDPEDLVDRLIADEVREVCAKRPKRRQRIVPIPALKILKTIFPFHSGRLRPTLTKNGNNGPGTVEKRSKFAGGFGRNPKRNLPMHQSKL